MHREGRGLRLQGRPVAASGVEPQQTLTTFAGGPLREVRGGSLLHP